MATDNERLIYEMSANITKLEKAMNRAFGTVNSTNARIEKRFDRMYSNVLKSTGRFSGQLRTAIAAVGVTFATSEVISYADAWTDAENKLGNAGVALNNMAATQARLVAISQESRSELTGTIDLFARMKQATENLADVTDDDLFNAVTTINKSFVAGGRAASEQKAAIMQLGQALGSGVLQGDELRSIRENAPGVARAIAAEFDTTVAGLKELGAEGELTAERVLKGILAAGVEVDRQFARTETTVAQATNNLRTAFTVYVAGLDDATGSTEALAGFINQVANNLPLLANAAVIATAAFAGMAGVRGLQAVHAGLMKVSGGAGVATGAMIGLQRAMAFLGGPWGIAIGVASAALAGFAFNGVNARVSIDQLRASTSKYVQESEKLHARLKEEQEELKDLQQQLKETQATLDAASLDGREREVELLQTQITKTKELIELNRANLALQLNAAKNAQFNIVQDVTSNAVYRQADKKAQKEARQHYLENRDTVTNVNRSGNFFFDQDKYDELRKSYYDQALEDITSRAELGEIVSKSEQRFVNQWTEYRNVLMEIEDLEKRIEKNNGEGVKRGYTVVSAPWLEMQKLMEEFASEREKLFQEIDKDFLASTESDRDRIRREYQELVKEIERVHPADKPERQAYLNKAAQIRDTELESINQREAEDAANQQREARDKLESSLQYELALTRAIAEARGDNARVAELDRELAILQEIQTLRGLGLTDEAEIERKAIENVNARMEAERFAGQERIRIRQEELSLEDQLEIARASGDFKRRKALEYELEMRRKIAEYIAAGYSDDEAKRLASAHLKELRKYDEEVTELQQAFRDAFVNGVREGIATDDWGTAIKNVFADALTRALDDALRSLSDLLFDFIGGMAKGAGSYIGSSIFGGNRAGGGDALPGHHYRVNEQGREWLYMGKGKGEIFNTDQLSRMFSGGMGRSNVVLNATSVFNISGTTEQLADLVEERIHENNQQQANEFGRMVDQRVTKSQIRRRI